MSEIFIFTVEICAFFGLGWVLGELLIQLLRYFIRRKIQLEKGKYWEMYALKSCPFCGGEAKMTILPNADTFDDIFVKCQKCGVHTIDYSTEEQAEDAWNRRVEESQNER